MSFLAFILKGLARQRTRTLLTILGIGIGITTVVALGSVASGLKAASGEIAHLGGADFMVAQPGAADLSFSTLTDRDLQTIRGVDGVERAWGTLFQISRVGSNPFFVTYGVELAEMPHVVPRLTAGRLPHAPDEVALGATAAADLDLAPGDPLTIERHRFTVVGLYTSSAAWERSGAYAALPTIQAAARKPGVITMTYVEVAAGTPVDVVAERIHEAGEIFAVIETADDYAAVDQGMKLLDAANLAISLLAVVIGAVGVMNTMIMSVFERTREIGILRAVGWRRSRVLRMIVGESLALCLLATGAGILLGVGATRLVVLIPAIGSFLTPVYPVSLFVRALVIAVAVALAGALYPALRAIRFSPMEALRHE